MPKNELNMGPKQGEVKETLKSQTDKGKEFPINVKGHLCSIWRFGLCFGLQNGFLRAPDRSLHSVMFFPG